MQKVFSVLMMALSLLIGFQQAIIILHFKLNQAAIEQKFCINKDKPELHCHGVCHLKEQLKKNEHSDSASVLTYQKVDMLPFSRTEYLTEKAVTEIQPKISIYKRIFYIEPYREIFVPPPNA